MTHSKLAVAAAIAAALFGSAAHAQVENRDSHGASPGNFDRSVGYSQYLGSSALRASDLIGATVRNREERDLGEIEDLMVSRSGDNIVTAVLSVGGILGIGEKRIAVPYDELRVSEDGESFYLSATTEQLEARPTFQYPERRQDARQTNSSTSGARDLDGANRAAETRAAAQANSSARAAEQSAPVVTDTPPATSRAESHDVRTMERAARRASNIIGTTVTDSRGESLGEVDDLVVNPQGRIEAVLSVGGVLGVGERLIALPMEELQIERTSDNDLQVRIDTTKDQLLDGHPEFRYEPQAAIR